MSQFRKRVASHPHYPNYGFMIWTSNVSWTDACRTETFLNFLLPSLNEVSKLNLILYTADGYTEVTNSTISFGISYTPTPNDFNSSLVHPRFRLPLRTLLINEIYFKFILGVFEIFVYAVTQSMKPHTSGNTTATSWKSFLSNISQAEPFKKSPFTWNENALWETSVSSPGNYKSGFTAAVIKHTASSISVSIVLSRTFFSISFPCMSTYGVRYQPWEVLLFKCFEIPRWKLETGWYLSNLYALVSSPLEGAVGSLLKNATLKMTFLSGLLSIKFLSVSDLLLSNCYLNEL